MTENKYIIIERSNFPKKGGVEHTALKFSVFNKRSGHKLGQHKTKELAEAHIERLLATVKKGDS